jgi:hypothetical protein
MCDRNVRSIKDIRQRSLPSAKFAGPFFTRFGICIGMSGYILFLPNKAC